MAESDLSRDEVEQIVRRSYQYVALQGFFIPNKQKKYSVGENAGMKLDDSGEIEIHVAAERPKGVPKENWLPIDRKDLDLDVILRVYQPDLKRTESWEAPKAEKLSYVSRIWGRPSSGVGRPR